MMCIPPYPPPKKKQNKTKYEMEILRIIRNQIF